MLTAGVVNSVDAQPARTTYARQWIYDPQQEVLQEINPSDGQPLTMSAEAREAISRGAGTIISGTPAQLQPETTGGDSDTTHHSRQ